MNHPERTIAVLGAGSGGHCMAADLTLNGHSVILVELPDFADQIELVAKTKTIRLSGMGRTGDASLSGVTVDLAAAATEADLINVVVPAFGQTRFFEDLIPHLEDRHTVVVWAGDFGSLELRAMLHAQRPDIAPCIVETNTIPYGTRLTRPGEAYVSVLAPQVLAAAVPINGDDHDLRLSSLQALWPVVQLRPDAISVALSNPNPIVHPPGTLLNVGRIQYSGGDFNLYREGITEAIARVIRDVYREIEHLARALGAQVVEYPDAAFRTKTSIMGVAFQAEFDTDKVIGDILGPKSINDRYLTEDLPYGLVPAAELGDLATVNTPLIDSIINLGSSVCGRDFWTEGRGLKRLGLAELTADEIIPSVMTRAVAGAL